MIRNRPRYAVAHSLRSPFVVEEVDLPDLQHTDVLVRIVAVGICHTDIASRDGQLPAPFRRFLVMREPVLSNGSVTRSGR